MKNKTAFAIGVLIQWYEVEIVGEYFKTLAEAIKKYDGSVIIDVTVVAQTQLEKPKFKCGEHSMKKCRESIFKSMWKYLPNVRVHYRSISDSGQKWPDIKVNSTIFTIADYRREFNEKYCDVVDLLIWGESDMLVPKQMFTALDLLHQQVSENTPKYITTFGICKMWDDSWKPLEHVKFTDKPFIENDYENWWSLKYTMNESEMNLINEEVEELDVATIKPFKFNGCSLVISSEVIRSGVNIPRSVFFVHEDTAFQIMLQKLLPNIPQYHIRNLLVVHNRNHPKKRMYIDESVEGSMNKRRRSNEWYVKANKFSEENCYNIFNPTYKAKSWNDVFDSSNL